jgi:hypothetical protein
LYNLKFLSREDRAPPRLVGHPERQALWIAAWI